MEYVNIINPQTLQIIIKVSFEIRLIYSRSDEASVDDVQMLLMRLLVNTKQQVLGGVSYIAG